MGQIIGIVVGFLVTVLVTLLALWVIRKFKVTREFAGLNAPKAGARSAVAAA